MKIKTILTLSALAAAGAATAAVSSTNTLCRIAVNSGTTNTIIGVSLAKIGTTSNESLPVSSMVLTDNLNAGDLILHWNTTGEKWDAWILSETSGVKAWTPTIVASGSTYSSTAPTADTALERGDALWVKRVSGSDDLTKPFYIYGQVGNVLDTYKTISVAAGTSTTPAYTLIGNPQLQFFPLLALTPQGGYLVSGTSPAVGDKVVFGATNAFGYAEYTWQVPYDDATAKAWCRKGIVTTESGRSRGWIKVTDTTIGIGPGEGCWYVSYNSSTPTIQWRDGTTTSNE